MTDDDATSLDPSRDLSQSGDPPISPQRPRKVFTQVSDSGIAVEFSLRLRQIAVMGFLMLWLAGWSAGCFGILHQLITHFQWKLLAFACPFWIAEIFVIGLLLKMVTGKEFLRISSAGIEHEETSILGRKVQQLAFSELRALTVGDRTIGKNGSGRAYGLKLESTQKPITFGLGSLGPTITHEEALWLQHEALLAIGTHGGDEVFDRLVRNSDDAPPQSALADTMGQLTAALTSTPSPLSPDRLRVEDMPDGVHVTRPEEFSFSALAGITFVTLFWNSIVSVFIWALIFDPPPLIMRVFMFFFLIPFELIGLAMIIAWVGTLLAPVRDQVWLFAADQIVTRWRLMGMSLWSKTVRGSDVRRLRCEPAQLSGLVAKFAKDPDALRKAQEQLREKGGWQISVYGDADQIKLTVPYLTEQQARRIEVALRRRLATWFDETSQAD